MSTPENNKSRQCVTRVLIPVHNLLKKKAKKSKGVATEINRILNAWYTAETGNDPRTGEPIGS